MQADSRGVKVHFDSTTTWPLTTPMSQEVHGEIISKVSRDEMAKIGSTTTQPPDAAAHGGAHGEASSKKSASYKEHFDVTTP